MERPGICLVPSIAKKLVDFLSGTASQPITAVAIEQLTDEQRAKLVANLVKAVDISRQGFTSVITIEATSRSASKAATIANTIAGSYFDLQIETRAEKRSACGGFLRARVNELASAIVEGNQRLNQFVSEHRKELGTAEVRAELGQLHDEMTSPSLDQQTLSERQEVPQNIAVGLYRLQRDVETNRKLYDSYVARFGGSAAAGKPSDAQFTYHVARNCSAQAKFSAD